MAAIIKMIYKSYELLDTNHSDPRTSEFLFMSSILYPLSIVGLYYYIVRHLIPNLMKDRPPFKLKNTLLLYNLVQVVSNFALFVVIVSTVIADDYKVICEPIDKYNERHTASPRFAWFYFLLKITDLLDTVFFVLRKKEKQVTFLHLYHHAGMIMFIWIGVKYCPDGHTIMLPLLNTAVHTVMYAYYLVSNWDPKLITLRMKKTVTQMQIFLTVIILNTLALFKEDCDYPKVWIMIILTQGIFLSFLFFDFYIRTYRKKKPQ